VTNENAGIVIADQLFKVACCCSAPIFWYSPAHPENILNNGTVFFVDIGRGPFGVSALHVFDGYRTALVDGPLICQLADITFEPCQRRIGEDPASDIVSFSITVPELEKMGRYAHSPLDKSWPVQSPQEGDDIFFGGYRGADKTVKANLVTWGFARALETVTTSYEDYLTIQFDREEWLSQNSPRPPDPNEGWGGVSGGPVFSVTYGTVLSWRLVGVVTEFNIAWEIVRASSLSKVRPDGLLRS